MAVEASLMVAISQILEGEATCDECERPAQVTLSAEPDYEDTPMCWTHARPFVEVALDMANRFYP